MKLIKTILINLLIVVLILMASASVYFANYKGYPVFADSAPSGYSPVTSDTELAQSFNDYCKSRDASFTSSMPGATYTYIYNYMKKGASYLGYNIDEIQEGLYKSYTDSGTIGKWYMTTQTIDFYNRLFAYLINENELEVGDIANKTLYSGQIFIDDNDNYCLITLITVNPSSANYGFFNTRISAFGTPIVKSGGSDALSFINLNPTNHVYCSFVCNNITYNFPIYKNNNYVGATSSASNLDSYYISNYNSGGNYINIDGFPSIIKSPNGNYYYGVVNSLGGTAIRSFEPGNSSSDVNIAFVTIDNKTINNNNYEGDTIITNEGDVINEGDTNINYNPYPGGGGTTTPPGSAGGSGSGGTINLPDIDLDLPSINWSIGDLSSKFPFSIPFDLIAFFTVLNAEPETPEIHGTLNLAIINYQFDFDLHDFDDLASLLRNLEFIGFCIGLILITRNMLRV